MQSALIFILRTLFDLYVLVFVLRLLMQWVRVDTRNPFVQFILRVTNPLVMPLRRLLPPVGRLDSATLMALLGLQMLGTVLITQLACIGRPGMVPILLLTVLGIARLILTVYFWTVIIYTVLSWVSAGGYNPAAALVSASHNFGLVPTWRAAGRHVPLWQQLVVRAVPRPMRGFSRFGWARSRRRVRTGSSGHRATSSG